MATSQINMMRALLTAMILMLRMMMMMARLVVLAVVATQAVSMPIRIRNFFMHQLSLQCLLPLMSRLSQELTTAQRCFHVAPLAARSEPHQMAVKLRTHWPVWALKTRPRAQPRPILHPWMQLRAHSSVVVVLVSHRGLQPQCLPCRSEEVACKRPPLMLLALQALLALQVGQVLR